MGKQWKQWQALFSWAADGDCSYEIKRCLLLGRKVMTNLDSILKTETLLCFVRLIKAMVFPVVTYGCESWTIKKAECQRIDAFELWCWRRLLRVPWTARRPNQSILKESSPACLLEGLISFGIDWFDLLAVQGTLKSLLQCHSSKASVLQCLAFFTVQLSHSYITTGKTIALTRPFLAK